MAETEKRQLHVVFVHAPTRSPYAGISGLKKLDEELSFSGNSGVVVDPQTKLPLEIQDGRFAIWVGFETDLEDAKTKLANRFGLEILSVGIIEL